MSLIVKQRRRLEILEYFEELCGPHLNQDVYAWTNDDLEWAYRNSIENMLDEAEFIEEYKKKVRVGTLNREVE